MRYFLFLGFIFFALGVSAQGVSQRMSDLQNVIPPSPNASSLGKYADWPINLYTGVPNIDIPLYELKGRSINVPVSLSYHASGIKVGEVSSSVGLGWALNGGGVITRSVRGLPDDAGGVGYLDIRKQYTNPGDLTSAPLTAHRDSTNASDVAFGKSDSEPDLYMFNALGRSFKFFFGGNGTILTQPYSKVIINFHQADSTWRVTLDDGTKLVFGGGTAVELTNSTRSVAANSDLPSFISAWYLKTITTVTGEIIKFTYEKSTINQDACFYQADYLYQSTAASSSCATGGPPVKQPFRYFETQGVTMLNLLSIESDICKVSFINDTTGRIDLKGAKCVKEMDVYSKLTGKYIHKFTFQYSYSTAVNSNSYTTPNSSQCKYRLKLNSIQEVPLDNSSPKIWSFVYNPLTLPSRQSYAQDHWGYYNGAVSNTTMLPSVPGFNNPGAYTSGVRDGDSTSMSAEMLIKIVYPTGGFTKFNYEPNSVPTTKDYQVSLTTNTNLYLTANQNPYSNTKTQTFTITQGQYINLSINTSFSSSITNDYGPSIILGSVAILNSSQTNIGNINIVNSNVVNGHYNASQYINLSPGTYTVKVSSISSSSDFVTSSDFVSIQSTVSYNGSSGVRAFNLLVGGLRIKSLIDSSGSTPPMIKTFKYESPNVVPFDTVNGYLNSFKDNTFDCNGGCTPTGGGGGGGGGDGGSQQQCTTIEYFTLNPDGSLSSIGSTTTCSGGGDPKTYSLPKSKFNYYAGSNQKNRAQHGPIDPQFQELPINENQQDYLTANVANFGASGYLISSYVYQARNSSTKFSLGSIQGGTVGYGKVTTTYGPNGENGYTISYFSQASDLNSSSAQTFPYPPVVPVDWQKGLLTKEITYTSSNIPLKKSTNSYIFTNQQSITTFKAALSYNILTSCFSFTTLGDHVTQVPYQIVTQQVQKTNSSNVNYYNNATDSVVTNTNFFYDDVYSVLPIRAETLNSRGENLKTLSRTALEKSDINASIPLTTTASAAIDTMVARNIISSPIEVETYNNNVLVGKALTNYGLFFNNVLPQEVVTVDGANPAQSRVLFNYYNNKGSLLEQQKNSAPLNDYIWDYASNYVTAAVINGSKTGIAYTSFEADSTGNWTISSLQRDSVTMPWTGTKSYNLSAGNISKSGLSSATTYVVSYWTRSSSPLTIVGTVSGFPIKGATVNGWTFYEHQITGQTTVTLSGTGNIDELRLYPTGALMTSYTYSPSTGITSMTNAKGEVSFYEYDNLQRLMNVKDIYGNIIKHIDYHYQGQ